MAVRLTLGIGLWPRMLCVYVSRGTSPTSIVPPVRSRSGEGPGYSANFS